MKWTEHAQACDTLQTSLWGRIPLKAIVTSFGRIEWRRPAGSVRDGPQGHALEHVLLSPHVLNDDEAES